LNISTPSLSITVRPSRVLLASLTFLHVLATITIIFVSISIWLKLVIVALIVAMGMHAIYKIVMLKERYAVIQINASVASTLCHIELKNGNTFQANLKHAGWIFEFLLRLYLVQTKKY